MRKLELLAPARDLQCGIAAIDCGADAVYMGAPKFGARAAAGNSIDDIRQLSDYAHRFSAKVYVTLNTIVYDNELDEVHSLLGQIGAAGADGILVQDMAVLDMARQMGLTVHASTQTDNRDNVSVEWLKSLGCSRVVLARELSLDEIRAIHDACPETELEVFVHGALCVSYSGACYASQYCFHRSANRGECAQFCRLKFDLIDADGHEWEHQRHLLSLRDMCRIEHLEELADAGVVSFKIEGRLKDAGYVKNVVAAYSQQLDRICKKRVGDYCRASVGKASCTFTPDLNKTFNRGYTDYFLAGRKPDIFSPDTPKAIGEYVGRVKEMRGRSFTVAGLASFSNGDGLCFINANRELEGFRVNRAEGNRLFLTDVPEGLRPGLSLYRNHDVAFEKLLAATGTERKIPLTLTLAATPEGFSLTGEGEGLHTATVEEKMEKQPARKPQHDNIVSQLSRWGGTIYRADDIRMADGVDACFIPSSLLSQLRQRLCAALEPEKRVSDGQKTPVAAPDSTAIPAEEHPLRFKNVSNGVARNLYLSWGTDRFTAAMEAGGKDFPLPLMQCRHCLRFSLGYCVKRGGRRPEWKEPLRLRLGDGRRFRLEFDCKRCQMNIYAE